MHLVLDTPGTCLRKENELFLVETEAGRRHVVPTKVQSLTVHRGVLLSADAVLLALTHEVELLFADGGGFPAGRVWSGKYGSVATIRKNQWQFARSPAALGWVQQLLVAKIDHQLALLLTLGQDEELRLATGRMETLRDRIARAEGTLDAVSGSLRGWEGTCGRLYFEQVARHLPAAYAFAGRSQHPALDMFNCLLNYAYGVLYGRVEGALVRAGLDPYAGIFHRDEYNRPVLVYDVIERFRVWAEYVVVDLCCQQVIYREFFELRPHGDGQTAFWLAPEGKRILLTALHDYLAEVVALGGQSRSRLVHLDLYAQQLAQGWKHWSG